MLVRVPGADALATVVPGEALASTSAAIAAPEVQVAVTATNSGFPVVFWYVVFRARDRVTVFCVVIVPPISTHAV